jgi:hypothetical protein
MDEQPRPGRSTTQSHPHFPLPQHTYLFPTAYIWDGTVVAAASGLGRLLFRGGGGDKCVTDSRSWVDLALHFIAHMTAATFRLETSLVDTCLHNPMHAHTRVCRVSHTHHREGGPSAAFVLGGVDARGAHLYQIESDGTTQPVGGCGCVACGDRGGWWPVRFSFRWMRDANSYTRHRSQARFTALGSGFAAAMAILEAQHR